MTGTEDRRPDGDEQALRSPRAIDALLGVGVALTVSLFIASDVGRTEPDGWAYLWAVGLGGLMLVRRRYPVLVVTMSVGAVISYYAAGYPPIGVAVPLAAAVFSAAEYGRAVAAIIASAVMIIVSVAYRLAEGQDPAVVVGYELPGHALLLAGAVAFGDSVRSRREIRKQSDEIAELLADRYVRETEQRIVSERLAIARELHDSVGHALTVIGLHAQVLEEQLDSDDPELRGSLRAISDTTEASYAELRRTVAGLREQPGGPRHPLRISDLATAARPAEQAGLAVRTDVSVHSPLSPAVESAIFRIVQESITNVVRHAGASRVEIDVRESGGRVEVSVIDDGTEDQAQRAPGAPRAPGSPGSPKAPGAADEPGSARSGSGIAGMRERIQLLGGTFSAGRRETGFVVRASIPLEAEE